MQIDTLLAQISYPYKARVRADALQLQQKNPTLRLSAGEIVHNDGTRASLIMLDGTIPMFSGGVKYNAPVAIYIVYNFPEACPLVYVRPVAGMMIRPGHPFVDNSGLTTDPYLTSWRASTSTLSGLVDALTRSFSASPPVYSIPAPLAPGQPSAYGAATNTAHSGYAVAYSANAGYGGGASPAYQPPTVGSVTAVTRAVAASSVSRKDDLVARVTARLQEEMTLYYSRVRDEIDKEFACQSELTQRRAVAESKLTELAEARRDMEREIGRLTAQRERLEAWTEQHAADTAPEVESLLVPFDGVSAQLTALAAENLAIDDTMYYLERALASQRNRSVDLPIFLREVRTQSGKQFANQLHSRRIRAVLSSSGNP